MPFQDCADLVIDQILDQFGQTVEYYHESDLEVPIEVEAVFENKFISIETGMGVSTTSHVPTLYLKASDIPTPSRGDIVDIGALRYRIREIQADGDGGLLLLLKGPV